ncbi:hypothetical protein ZOSMA_31G01150 [Zostera marina]|uniref:Uncharacterized protein n=1 Tax=Zostera marina TaxID=29655 RepID=A0A0K9PB98_ZOSMR|nr:hypothetical protein ZOSMA_31G01150 [Zostera marina]
MAHRGNHGIPRSPIVEEFRPQSGDSKINRGTSDIGNRTSSSDSNGHRSKSLKINDSRYDFWDVVAKKARYALENDNVAFQQHQNSNRNHNETHQISAWNQVHQSLYLSEESRKKESPKLQKKLNETGSSISYKEGKVRKCFDENAVVKKLTDTAQQTNKLNTRRSKSHSNVPYKTAYSYVYQPSSSHVHLDQETQLKAARDVANAMAAKVKLLMRELKTLKSDLSFANERCAQFEVENKILSRTRDKRVDPEDDDLICLQLEKLLAEKARLTHENSMCTRENQFLREIVEYNHRITQSIEYLDEDTDEFTDDIYSILYPQSFLAPETP